MFCRAGNKYIPKRKRSRPNFLFRERTFLFRDRTVVWLSVARSDNCKYLTLDISFEALVETSIPSIQKVSASSFSSRGLSFSSIWTVRPRYARSDNCPISEKKKFSLGKESSPSSFSISEQRLSSHTEHIFPLWFWKIYTVRASLSAATLLFFYSSFCLAAAVIWVRLLLYE